MPCLGYLVRKLTLATYRSDYESTYNYIQILQSCPLLQHLRIRGYSCLFTKQYRDVIAKLGELRSLNIDHCCLGYFDAQAFIYDDELLEMLRGWPEIRQIWIRSMARKDKDRVALMDYCTKRGIYIELRPRRDWFIHTSLRAERGGYKDGF